MLFVDVDGDDGGGDGGVVGVPPPRDGELRSIDRRGLRPAVRIDRR